MFLTYLVLFGILKSQEKYGHLFKAKCEDYKPSVEEIENIIKVQNSDENEENISKKIRIRIKYFIFGVLLYSITLANFPELSAL